jgi:hypothetical protein
MKTMNPQEREQKAIESMNKCSKLRNELITETENLATIVQGSKQVILCAAFTRKWNSNHIQNWWKNRGPSFINKWRHDEAYASAASKLTTEERKVLGI